MKYLLDTNICIKYLNGSSENIRKNIASKKSEQIFLCSVVKAELFYSALMIRLLKFTDKFVLS